MTSMRVGIIGAGHIGGNIARRLALAGHEVVVSFARDQAGLAALAAEVGGTAAEPSEAAKADVVVVSVPWGVIDEALAAAGPLDSRIVIDTTNQFGRGVSLDLGGRTAARVNAERMPGARYTKSFNTLTAGFQAAAAGRAEPERVVQWVAGDDEEAKAVAAALISDAGYVPVDLAGIDGCAVMEAPRRAGAVYGEEYRAADAAGVVAAVRAGRPIPPTPSYSSVSWPAS
jgi:predicted dinucleotide-binding enzyme